MNKTQFENTSFKENTSLKIQFEYRLTQKNSFILEVWLETAEGAFQAVLCSF